MALVDAALTSGVLLEPADTELLNQLHQWRDEVNGFYRRLELTETRVFAAGSPNSSCSWNPPRRDHGRNARSPELGF
jgi:hypothetical protein